MSQAVVFAGHSDPVTGRANYLVCTGDDHHKLDISAEWDPPDRPTQIRCLGPCKERGHQGTPLNKLVNLADLPDGVREPLERSNAD